MTTILITGAAGFVGRHFAKALARAVPEAVLVGLDRDFDMPGCHQRIVCDLADTHVFQTLQAVGPIDYVVHLAARSDVHFSLARPDIYIRDNVLATSNLIQALGQHRSIKRFLSVSSCEVYGNTPRPAVETDLPKPRTPYAASKLAQEHIALSAIDHQSIPTVVCRLFNNYGHGQQANRLIPRILQAIHRDEKFELVGDGSQTRDWVSVQDTCDALIRLLFEPKVQLGDIFNISAEEVYSVLQVLELCEASSNRSLLTDRSNKDPGHLEKSSGNGEKLRSVTGWRPRETLRAFLDSVVKSEESVGD
ncbi:dTDP-D-glucose 4,6-dehydratase [Mycobacterium sp. JS623]|uniref:NAD-dependent epimerase/dehydratase family protein n=1 Tax=Mycobacterium sp. JS623 TaxID=212767 RepID=UPI0002A584D8|nr:NAD-dependent epimerase/dehydratase family protein [Mycobacterium sp. JS623]AGB21753.1 dTDP-D-glucose 4,6-dehydratase [Mycobacterium sp. JS623]